MAHAENQPQLRCNRLAARRHGRTTPVARVDSPATMVTRCVRRGALARFFLRMRRRAAGGCDWWVRDRVLCGHDWFVPDGYQEGLAYSRSAVGYMFLACALARLRWHFSLDDGMLFSKHFSSRGGSVIHAWAASRTLNAWAGSAKRSAGRTSPCSLQHWQSRVFPPFAGLLSKIPSCEPLFKTKTADAPPDTFFMGSDCPPRC